MSVILFTGEGGLCMMSFPIWLPGPMFLLERGSLCLVKCSFQRVSVQGVSVWGISVREVFVQGDLCPGVSLSGRPPDRDPHIVKTRWYASYWKAFLFFLKNFYGHISILRPLIPLFGTSVVISKFHSFSRKEIVNEIRLDSPLASFRKLSDDFHPRFPQRIRLFTQC